MSRDTNIGKAAYEKWRELVPLGRGNPMWSELPASAQAGWEEIALAAVNAHLDEGNTDAP